jgi:hypothetical protein
MQQLLELFFERGRDELISTNQPVDLEALDD